MAGQRTGHTTSFVTMYSKIEAFRTLDLREYGSSTRVCELFEPPFRRLVYRPNSAETGFGIVDANNPETCAAAAIGDVNTSFEMIHSPPDFS